MGPLWKKINLMISGILSPYPGDFLVWETLYVMGIKKRPDPLHKNRRKERERKQDVE